MSGHSKWATIKHKKGAADAKRGKIFTRLIKETAIAARSGGDPGMNPRLRTAIAAAKAESMPADNIKRAIMRGTGELEGGQIEEVMYEGYGPAEQLGRWWPWPPITAIVRSAKSATCSPSRGQYGRAGQRILMFERKSQISIAVDKAPPEDDLDDAGARSRQDDLRRDGDTWEVLSAPENHVTVLETIQKKGLPTESAEIAMIPKNLMKLEGKNAAGMLRLSEAFEEHDDVQNVYSNFDIDEKELEALSS